MRVYEMSARYSRKVQVKQYEPAECEFEMKVELDETDNPTEVRAHIMQEVRDAVTQAFQGRSGKGAEIKVVQKTDKAPKVENDEDPAVMSKLNDEGNKDVSDEGARDVKVEKPKRGRPKGSKNAPKEEVVEWDTVPDEKVDVTPEEESNVVDLNPPKEAEPETEPQLTLAQVKTLMNKVTGDGVKVPKVRELLAQFGVASTTELDPSAYTEFYQLLSEIKTEELQL